MKTNIFVTWKQTYLWHENKHICDMKTNIFLTWKQTYLWHENKHICYMKTKIFVTWKQTYLWRGKIKGWKDQIFFYFSFALPMLSLLLYTSLSTTKNIIFKNLNFFFSNLFIKFRTFFFKDISGAPFWIPILLVLYPNLTGLNMEYQQFTIFQCSGPQRTPLWGQCNWTWTEKYLNPPSGCSCSKVLYYAKWNLIFTQMVKLNSAKRENFTEKMSSLLSNFTFN